MKHYWNGPGSEIPTYVDWGESYSTEGQDRWVLNVLNGKSNGTYVEVGSGHPVHGSNTFLLEKRFNWEGVSVDIDDEMVFVFHEQRKNPCISTDAISFSYESYFRNNHFPKQIDYLQIDVDDKPPAANLLALVALPLADYRFSTLTIEHGCVTDYKNDRLRDAQRLILDSFGYRLIIQGVNEDWWVDPSAVSYDNYGYMFSIGRIPG